jgi:conjugal transfer/entry exclusion protein
MNKTRMITIALTLVLGCWTPTHAQGIPVFDAANLVQNIVTAVQTVFMVANQVLELTPLGEIVVGDDFQTDLDSLGEIVQAAQGLSYDLASLNSQIGTLFNLQSVPRGSSALRTRLAEIRQVVFDCYVYALRTQTLLQTAQRTVRHLKALMAAVGDLVGNMQGNQTLTQMDSTLTATLEKLQVQTAAYNRAQSVERLSDVMMLQSFQEINDAMMEDYPK